MEKNKNDEKNNNDGFEKLNYLQKEIKYQAVKKKLC